MNTPRTIITSVILLTALSLTPCSQVKAGVFKGNIYTELYGFDQQDTAHLRIYSGLQGNWQAWQGKNQQRVELRTSFRWTTDLEEKQTTDPQLFVREGYFRIANVPQKSEFLVGRQFAYNSLQSVLLDGIRTSYTIHPRATLDLFGGAAVLGSDPEAIQNITDYGTAGARFNYGSSRSIRAGLHWFYRKHQGNEATHRVGLDMDKTFDYWLLYGKAAYNIPQNRLSEILGRLSVRPRNWYLAAEFSYREPYVSDATLFSIIDFDRNRQTRLEARRTIWRTMALGGQLHYTLGDQEDSWRTIVGLSSPIYSIGWSHQQGYGGDSDGLYGSLSARLSSRFEVYASTNLNRYRVQPEQDGRSDSYGSALGLLWRSRSGFTIRAEGQWFKNAVVTSQSRFYLRIAKDFSFGASPAGGNS